MSKKKNQKQSAKQSAYHPPRTERNEFLKNHPFAYLIVAIIAFVLGNYLFDYIGQLF